MDGKRERAKCRNCGLKYANRPGLLCWTCYYTPGVAHRYPPCKQGRRGHGNVYRAAPALPEPTTALPASEEKVRVMEGRAARGEAIFHPDDATWEGRS